MWIVKVALHRPYTFVVLAILILLLGVASVATMPTDILPNIDIHQSSGFRPCAFPRFLRAASSAASFHAPPSAPLHFYYR